MKRTSHILPSEITFRLSSIFHTVLKTGASGMIAYRYQKKNGEWQWLQTSSRLVYKNSKPDFIICTHRQLMEEEGRDLLGKRTMDFKVSFLMWNVVMLAKLKTKIINFTHRQFWNRRRCVWMHTQFRDSKFWTSGSWIVIALFANIESELHKCSNYKFDDNFSNNIALERNRNCCTLFLEYCLTIVQKPDNLDENWLWKKLINRFIWNTFSYCLFISSETPFQV